MNSSRRALALPVLAIVLLAGLVGSAAARPIVSLSSAIQGIVEELKQLLGEMRIAFLGLGKVLSGALLALGAVLWASDIFSYKGRRLLTSASILLLLLEMIS